MSNNLEAIVAERIHDFQKMVAERLNVSEDTLERILSGEVKVARIALHKDERSRVAGNRDIFVGIKRLAILIMAFLLIASFTVDGFADNIREHLLRIISGYQSVQVETIQYGRIQNLEGAYLPMVLPADYKYHTHTQPTDSNLFLVEYSNAEGSTIEYYYYPQGASSLLDNEHTAYREYRIASGIVRIGLDDAGTTIVYCPLGDSAYVHMEITDASVNDKTILAMLASIERQE